MLQARRQLCGRARRIERQTKNVLADFQHATSLRQTESKPATNASATFEESQIPRGACGRHAAMSRC
jgi:hypothetical protein